MKPTGSDVRRAARDGAASCRVKRCTTHFHTLTAAHFCASQVTAEVLRDERVHFSLGIPGIQNLTMYAGLERTGSRAVLISNEESAAFAAAGIFEASQGTEIACVNIIGGPGVTHALAGIAIAHAQQVPMLVLTAGIKTGVAHKSH